MSMLTIYSINPTGMFSYGKCEDIQLMNKGLIHLKGLNHDKGGDSNGSGKSSLFNALCELLFQENPTGVKGDGVINSVWNKGMAGRVLFTAGDGHHYRVTYCRNWKDQLYPVDNDNGIAYLGTNLFLDRYDPDAKIWRDFRGSGMPATHLKILEILGISYERFLAISYMSNRTGNQFLRGTNRDRMDLLVGIIGIGEWDLVQDRARKKKKALNDQIKGMNESIAFERGAIQTLQGQLSNYNAVDWAQQVIKLNVDLNEARDRYKKSQEKVVSCDASIQELKNQQSQSYNQEYLASVDNELKLLGVQIQDEERSLSTPISISGDHSLEASRDSLKSSLMSLQYSLTEAQKPVSPGLIAPNADLVRSIDSIKEAINRTKGKYEFVKSQDSNLLSVDNCPTCGQAITDDQKYGIINSKNLELQSIEKVLNEYSSDLHRNQAALDSYVSEHLERLKKERESTLIDLQAKIVSVEAEHASICEKIEADIAEKRVKAEQDRTDRSVRLTSLRARMQELNNDRQKEIEKYQQFSVQIQQMGETLSGYRSELSKHQSDGMAIKSSIENCESKIKDIQALSAQIEEKQGQIALIDSNIMGLNNDLAVYSWLIDNIPSIKLHKMSLAMSEISNLVNQYFENMGESLRVRISAFAEKAKAKHAADIKDLLKAEVSLEITDGNKNISPRLYSDGEISKVSLAIAKSLHEMARKSGQGCNLMLLDEIFGFVDNNNSERMAQSLSSILNRGTVFLTDNSGKVQDLVNFSHTWVAEKKNGQTKLVTN